MPKIIRSIEDRLRIKTELLQLAESLGNISEACRRVGCSRDSYYRHRRRRDGGEDGAARSGPGHGDAASDRAASRIEQAVLEQARINPSLGRLMVSKILYKSGFPISPSGVRLIWLRWGLATSASRKRWAATVGEGMPNTCCRPATGLLSDDNMTGGSLDFLGHGITRKSEG
jgi:transposase-like protein